MTFPNGNFPIFFPVTPVLTNFVPKRREITAVTNSIDAEVTTSEPHLYQDGWFVRLHVGGDYGMILPSFTAKVEVTGANTFRTGVDTSLLSPFAAPVFPPAFTQAHCVPMTGTENNNTVII